MCTLKIQIVAIDKLKIPDVKKKSIIQKYKQFHYNVFPSHLLLISHCMCKLSRLVQSLPGKITDMTCHFSISTSSPFIYTCTDKTDLSIFTSGFNG